jgi:drug/metabolite transporter (DMT)-like permease
MLLAIVIYGFYTAALRVKPDLHWMSLMAGLCLGAVVSAIPFVAAEAAAGALIMPDALGWAIIAYVVLFPSLIGQAFYIRAVELIGANRAGLFINFLPLWGALLAVLILGEAFHLYHVVALALIFGGIWLAERGGRKPPLPRRRGRRSQASDTSKRSGFAESMALWARTSASTSSGKGSSR